MDWVDVWVGCGVGIDGVFGGWLKPSLKSSISCAAISAGKAVFDIWVVSVDSFLGSSESNIFVGFCRLTKVGKGMPGTVMNFFLSPTPALIPS